MVRKSTGVVTLVLGCLIITPTAAVAGKTQFRRLLPGVHYATFASNYKGPVKVSDRWLHVVRVDPARAKLVALAASALSKTTRTAARWAKEHELAVAINLGMYQNNQSTHVGYLRIDDHLNSSRWNSYASLLAFNPRERRFPPAMMADRSPPAQQRLLERYGVVTQNLRLIRSADGKRGISVWSPRRTKRWSEAAIAIDRRGRLLLLFCRAPLTMSEFNQLLLSLPLDVVRAAHVEGGPEASLSIHAGGVNIDLAGSFETGFFGSDGNHDQWPIPNVLGVLARPMR